MSKQVCLSSWLVQHKSNDITDSSLNSYSEIEETEVDLDEESLVEKESQLSEISDNEDEPMETSCKRQCCDMEAAVVSDQPYQSKKKSLMLCTFIAYSTLFEFVSIY